MEYAGMSTNIGLRPTSGDRESSAPGPVFVALAPLDINQRYTISETCSYLRTSRARLYQHIATGKIRVLKDGKRSYISGAEIAAQSRIA
jgi:excisionase family DNA binding protein